MSTVQDRSCQVSVVIPTRNRPALVRRAVASALSQTFNEIEVIVVVDGPDEPTVAAVREINDSRLKCLELPVNVGGADARNAGVRAARGEWIAFLDDDDEWLPEKLARQMEVASTLPGQYPVVTSLIFAKTPRGDFVWPRRLPEESEAINEYLFVRRSLFQADGLLPTPTWLVKKELMEMVPFQSGLKKHQDWDWVLRAEQVEGVGFKVVPEPLVNCYFEEQRKSVSTECMWKYSLEWLRERRDQVAPVAYACFVATQVAPQAARQRQWEAFLPLLVEMCRNGEPRPFDIAMYLAMWFMPTDLRRSFRSVFKRDSGKIVSGQGGAKP